MFVLVYVSSAVKPFSQPALVKLLEKSHVNNAKRGITGMLLYKDGSFMQVLEGEEEAVRTLYSRIVQDPRHRGVITLVEGPLAKREFPDSSMAFRDLDAPDVRSIPGYSEFLNTSLTGKELSADPTLCQKLLLTFKRNM